MRIKALDIGNVRLNCRPEFGRYGYKKKIRNIAVQRPLMYGYKIRNVK